MIRVLILVEGPTEETFVAELLGPHLQTREIYVTPILLTTKEVQSGPNYRGGVSSYSKIVKDIRPLLHGSSASMITTMLDYYGLPQDFPGMSTRLQETCFKQVTFLEQEFGRDINSRKFRPYLALHEFEAMMFAAPESIVNNSQTQVREC